MIYSTRFSGVKSQIKRFFSGNKKIIVCSLVIFFIGVLSGIFSCFRAVGGEFEQVLAKDADVGGARVFFFSMLALIGCYALILISGASNKTVLLCIIPFFLDGFFLGRYACALIGRYGALGVANLVFAYLPFFIATLACFVLSTIAVMQSGCVDNAKSGILKQSFVDTLKILGINVVISFVLFVLIGAIYGVIVVEVY